MAGGFPRSIWIPLVALSLIIFGWRLNAVPLTNWDEGIYANVNLELFRSQDWTKLTYFGADFLEKPPLQFWATAIFFGILGPTELAVRLLPALAGVGTVMLVALWVWQSTKQRWTALVAGAVFALGRFVLVHAFRTGDLDGALTFIIVLALYSYWRSWVSAKWIFIWGVASAAAVMTKSFVGLLPVMITGFDVLITRGWRNLPALPTGQAGGRQGIGWGNIAWAIGIFVALVAPWHIAETMRFGRTFWDSYIGVHVIERTTESLFTSTPWYWYGSIIANRFAPFSFFLPLAIVMAVWRLIKEKSDLDRLLLIWLGATLLIFSLIQTRREWYILPLYPAAAMLLALSAAQWWRKPPPRWLATVFMVSGVGAFGYLLTDNHLRLALQHFPLLRELAKPFWHSLIGQVIFGTTVMAGLSIVAGILRRRWLTWWKWIIIFSGGVTTAAALGWSLLYIYSLPSSLPLKTIAARVQHEQADKLSLIGTRLKKQPAGYFYILRLDTHSVEYLAGTPPLTPLVLTTNEEKNAPLNTLGKKLVDIPPLLLLDLR